MFRAFILSRRLLLSVVDRVVARNCQVADIHLDTMIAVAEARHHLADRHNTLGFARSLEGPVEACILALVERKPLQAVACI